MRNLLTAALTGALLASPIVLADDKNERVNNEAEIRISIEMEPEKASDACMASLEVGYYQKGSSVNVETRLENRDCAASAGSYTLEIRYRTAAGELTSKKYSEVWERSDAEPVILEKDYFVAENVDVVRVRSRKLRCTCATTEPDSDD